MLALAPGTWMKRPTPALGEGPIFNGRAKHIVFAYNTDNGRTYFLGGDWRGASGAESGRQELYSYRLETGEFTLEHPYCTGKPQPSGPDQVGWVWDSNRHLFWMIPGYMWDKSTVCPTVVLNRFMSLDPVKVEWAIANRLEWDSPGNHTYAAFDPIADAIYQFGVTSALFIYDLKTDTRREVKFSMPSPVRLGRSYHAMDSGGRRLFGIDCESTYKSAYCCMVDEARLIDIGGAFIRADALRTSAVWDSVNAVLYCVQSYGTEARVRLDVYHPDSKGWEFIGEDIDVAGTIVKGVNCFFDPGQNALFVGGSNQLNAVPFLFFYRYATSTSIEPPEVTRVNVG